MSEHFLLWLNVTRFSLVLKKLERYLPRISAELHGTIIPKHRPRRKNMSLMRWNRGLEGMQNVDMGPGLWCLRFFVPRVSLHLAFFHISVSVQKTQNHRKLHCQRETCCYSSQSTIYCISVDLSRCWCDLDHLWGIVLGLFSNSKDTSGKPLDQ